MYKIFLGLITTGIILLGTSAKGDHLFAQTSSPATVKTDDWTQMIEPISISASVILTMIGGIFTYHINESWKRRQYIEEKVKEFESERETINFRKILSDELQCIELFPFMEQPTHRYAVVEDCLWAEALLECKCNEALKEQYQQFDLIRDEPDFYKQATAKKARIRDDANRFLDYLQQFERMIKSKVVAPKELKFHLEAWIEFIKRASEDIYIVCPKSGEKYTPKIALLEYMGLLENSKQQDLSTVQKDVRSLISRYCPLSELVSKNKQINSDSQCVSTISELQDA